MAASLQTEIFLDAFNGSLGQIMAGAVHRQRGFQAFSPHQEMTAFGGFKRAPPPLQPPFELGARHGFSIEHIC